MRGSLEKILKSCSLVGYFSEEGKVKLLYWWIGLEIVAEFFEIWGKLGHHVVVDFFEI